MQGISQIQLAAKASAKYYKKIIKIFLQYRYHHFYLRKFCTLNFISQQMIFLPFILILAPMPLVAIGRLFLRW